MKIETDQDLAQAIKEFKEKSGYAFFEQVFDYFWKLKESIKVIRASRDKWKKLSMCSRCHKIIITSYSRTKTRASPKSSNCKVITTNN